MEQNITSAAFTINFSMDYEDAIPIEEVNDLIGDLMRLAAIVADSQCKNVDYEIVDWDYEFVD